jgi:hypothetical protein
VGRHKTSAACYENVLHGVLRLRNHDITADALIIAVGKKRVNDADHSFCPVRRPPRDARMRGASGALPLPVWRAANPTVERLGLIALHMDGVFPLAGGDSGVP